MRPHLSFRDALELVCGRAKLTDFPLSVDLFVLSPFVVPDADDVLELKPEATEIELKKAYRKLAIKVSRSER